MDPFSPDNQPLSSNGNGYSPNGASRNGRSGRGLPNENGYGEGGSELSRSASAEDLPERIPVLEDQGERFDKARRSAIKVYVVLIVTGVVIGGISLFGIVMLMQHFGLTDVPIPVEQN